MGDRPRAHRRGRAAPRRHPHDARDPAPAAGSGAARADPQGLRGGHLRAERRQPPALEVRRGAPTPRRAAFVAERYRKVFAGYIAPAREAAKDPAYPGARRRTHAARRDLARGAPARGAGAPLRRGLHAARAAAAPGADARGAERAARLPRGRASAPRSRRCTLGFGARGRRAPRPARRTVRAARCSRSAGRSAATAGRRAGRSTSVSTSTATSARGGGVRCRVRSRSSRARRTRSSRSRSARTSASRVARSRVVRFANENLMVQIDENVREADVFVIQTSCPPVSDGILELLITIDALRHASAARVTAVVPVLPVRALGQEGPPAHLDRGAPDGGPARGRRARTAC